MGNVLSETEEAEQLYEQRKRKADQLWNEQQDRLAAEAKARTYDELVRGEYPYREGPTLKFKNRDQYKMYQDMNTSDEETFTGGAGNNDSNEFTKKKSTSSLLFVTALFIVSLIIIMVLYKIGASQNVISLAIISVSTGYAIYLLNTLT